MLRKQTNRLNQTIRGAVLAFVALAVLAVTATAPAGSTGTIAISSKTGYRKTVPVGILRVNKQKRFVLAK